MTLTGKRVVATRAEGQTVELIKGLMAAGAIPIIFPTIQILHLEDYTAFDSVLHRLDEFDWIIFTSIHGVHHVLERLTVLGISPEVLKSRQVAAVGPATDSVLSNYGIQPSLRPDEYDADSIISALKHRNALSGKRFLLLRVDVSRAVLRERLTNGGAIVEEIAVYRTAPGTPDETSFRALRAGVDIITFTSSLTVKNFFTLLGHEALQIANRAKIACIGPITANTARDLGLTVHVVAEEFTVSGLLKALDSLT